MEIKPYSKNAKKHPQKQIEQIAASIKEFGLNQPIVVDKEGVIIVGHGRYAALQHLGMEVTDDMVKVVDLNEEQAKSYRLADNKLNESEWDMDLVVEELKLLSEPMVDLTGFDSDLLIEPEEKDDEVPESPEEPQSKLGDLYELGNHRVLCGDSTKLDDVERLMDGKKADMVFTDPPYNIAEKGKNVASNVKDGKAYNVLKESEWDYGFVATDFLNTLLPITKEGATVFVCTSHFLFGEIQKWMEEAMEYNNYCVWCKPNPMPSLTKRRFTWATELIVYGTRGKGFVFNFPSEGHALNYLLEKSPSHTTPHPTEKPVNIPTKFIELTSKAEDLVYDAFLGSGSTLIAAEKTGRICYGMELDPKYVDVIVQRYVDYTGNATIKRNGEEIIWQPQAN